MTVGRNHINYFEAKTGSIRTILPTDSSVRQYRVLGKHRKTIERAVAQAIPDPDGLLYKPTFMRDLIHWERKALQVRRHD